MIKADNDLNETATHVVDIPYDGLQATSGLGFALDQFAQDMGFHTFGEWSAEQFLKGRTIAGAITKSDEIETSKPPIRTRSAIAFGYEVTVWVTPSDDELCIFNV